MFQMKGFIWMLLCNHHVSYYLSVLFMLELYLWSTRFSFFIWHMHSVPYTVRLFKAHKYHQICFNIRNDLFDKVKPPKRWKKSWMDLSLLCPRSIFISGESSSSPPCGHTRVWSSVNLWQDEMKACVSSCPLTFVSSFSSCSIFCSPWIFMCRTVCIVY